MKEILIYLWKNKKEIWRKRIIQRKCNHEFIYRGPCQEHPFKVEWLFPYVCIYCEKYKKKLKNTSYNKKLDNSPKV